MNIAVLFGSRREALALAPIIQEFRLHHSAVALRIMTTLPPGAWDADLLQFFSAVPEYEGSAANLRQSPSVQVQTILRQLDYLFAMEHPDRLILHGHSVSTFAAGIAALHRNIPVALLHDGEIAPWSKLEGPEAMYRRCISQIADVHFLPMPYPLSWANQEGHMGKNIVCVGSTAVERVQKIVHAGSVQAETLLRTIGTDTREVLLGAFQEKDSPEQPDQRFTFIRHLAQRIPDKIVVVPLSMEKRLREILAEQNSDLSNIVFAERLSYRNFINVLAKVRAVITDSTSIQEESAVLGVPTVILGVAGDRQHSNRRGAPAAKGMDVNAVLEKTVKLLNAQKPRRSFRKAAGMPGDGRASERVVGTILQRHGLSKKSVKEFVPNG